MPYISTEALIGGALLIVLALGYQYLPQTTSPSSTSKSKKKNKKKNNAKTPIEQELDKAGSSSTGGGAKKGKKGKESAKIPTGTREQDSRDTSQRPSSSSLPETVGQKQSAESPSFAAVASASSQATKPKTLAERIAPKPRKTKVDE
jgi:hypothetical protein